MGSLLQGSLHYGTTVAHFLPNRMSSGTPSGVFDPKLMPVCPVSDVQNDCGMRRLDPERAGLIADEIVAGVAVGLAETVCARGEGVRRDV